MNRMTVKPRLDTAEMVRWYTEQHLTMREIGRLSRVSATAVMKRLHKAGITRQDGERVTKPCAWCGAKVTRTRSHALRRDRVYCGTEHYYADLENPGFQIWRHGGRQARAAVASHFPLTREQVVHHKNGNQRDNAITNLEVYASQADHMAMHRGREIAPVWDGEHLLDAGVR